MPLGISGSQKHTRLQLPNAVPIIFDAPANGIVPVLILGDRSSLPDGSALTPLPRDRKLVLVCDVDVDLAQPLEPQAILLRGGVPSGPVDAWEALDGLVTREPLTEGRVRGFVSHGVLVATQSPQRPANDLPWQRQGDFWVVRPVAPPVSETVSSAYDVVSEWHPAASKSDRKRLLAVACLCGLLCVGSLLYRRQAAVAVRGSVVAGCIVGLLAWRHGNSSLRFESGYLVLDEAGIEQIDEWEFYTASLPAFASTFSRPVPINADHAQAIDLACHVRERWIDWSFQLRDGQQLAALDRCCPDPPSKRSQTSHEFTPMLRFAKDVYAREHAEVLVLPPVPGRQQVLRDVQVINP